MALNPASFLLRNSARSINFSPGQLHTVVSPFLQRRMVTRVFDSASVREGTSITPIQASCLCKSIQFTLSSPPFTYSICHCKNCKKIAGSAFLAHAYFKPSQLSFKKGEEKVRVYKDADTTSGNILNRSFCSDCGSALFTQPKGKEDDYIIVAPGVIEGAEKWAPRKELHAHAKWEWVKEIEVRPKPNPKL
ncbi:Mss4-like protein [Cyathus striatus]|nr:Mss4-like protein [Cyathus striatus]